MFCPNCGTQNDESHAKCQKCGFNIKGAVAPKFKGTMLMMNAPPGIAQRAPSPVAAPVPKPGQPAPMAPAPAAVAPKKSLAKATMIGVAPPSPGAVAPPAPKPETKTGTLVQGSTPPSRPSVPPGVGGANIPRPAPAPAPAAAPAPTRQAGHPPVNPFGGTMLMGAVPEMQPGAPVQVSPPGLAPLGASAPTAVEEHGAFATSSTTPAPPNFDPASALSTTTPSVAPPAPADTAQKLPSEMATVASAVSPAIEPIPPAAAPAAQADWRDMFGAPNDAPLAVHSTPRDSLAPATMPKQQSAIVMWLLGIVTLGIYPLIVRLVRGKKGQI